MWGAGGVQAPGEGCICCFHLQPFPLACAWLRCRIRSSPWLLVPASNSELACPFGMVLGGGAHTVQTQSRTGPCVFITTNASPVSFSKPFAAGCCRQKSYFGCHWRQGGCGLVVPRACEPPGPGKSVSYGYSLLCHSGLLQRFEMDIITNVKAWEKVLRSELKGGIMPFSQDCLVPTGTRR